MKLLLTRPKDQAEAMKKELEEQGHEVCLAPMLRVQRMHHDRAAIQAAPGVVVTSANAVPALVGLDPRCRLFAVGPDTEAVLRRAGFVDITAAEGTAESLIAIIHRDWRAADGELVYASGRHISVNIPARLATAGISCRRIEVYATERAQQLPASAKRLLGDGGLEAALFMSARTAENFVELVEACGLAESCRSVTALSLSQKIDHVLAKLAWKRRLIARTPTGAGMLALVEHLAQD